MRFFTALTFLLFVVCFCSSLCLAVEKIDGLIWKRAKIEPDRQEPNPSSPNNADQPASTSGVHLQRMPHSTITESPQSHNRARMDFRDAHFNLEHQGYPAVGAMNLAITGDPKAKHSAPKTSFIEGKRAGKIVETFLKAPSTPLSDPNNHPSSSNQSPGGICVHIGDCRFINSNIKSRNPKGNQAKYSHTSIKGENVKKLMAENLTNSENSGHKFEKTSIHTVPGSQNAIRARPELKIKAGNSSGQYFSTWHLPIQSSPTRGTDPGRTNPPTTSGSHSPPRRTSPVRTNVSPDMQRGQKRNHVQL